MTEQETIERAVIGKRVVAVSWMPLPSFEPLVTLESITLEGGTRLELSASYGVVSVEVKDNADT